jgi:hypothetical protein
MLIGRSELETATANPTTNYDPLARCGYTDLTYPTVPDDESELWSITVHHCKLPSILCPY